MLSSLWWTWTKPARQSMLKQYRCTCMQGCDTPAGGLEGRISGNGAIRTPKAYAVRSPKGTPPTRSPITTPRHAGARTPGGSTVRTPTHKGLLVRTPTGESIIRTPTQNRDSFFKPPPLQMIATGLNRSPSTKSMGPDTPGGYSPFGMPPPPTWAMNEPLTPQNKLPPLRVPAALKNDSYAPSQTALSGHAGGGAPTTPGTFPTSVIPCRSFLMPFTSAFCQLRQGYCHSLMASFHSQNLS